MRNVPVSCKSNETGNHFGAWLGDYLVFGTFLSFNCFMFYVLVFKMFVLLAPYVCFHIFSKVKVTEWPPILKIATRKMFSWYKCLIVSLVFPTSVFGVGNFF